MITPFKFKTRGLVAALAAAFPVFVAAAPAPDSPYQVDAQNTYVHDASTRGIGVVNMITCLMSALKADVLVNEGRYLALIDEKKCSSERDSASQSTSTVEAPNYIQAIVESTRESNTAPMYMKAWFTLPEGGQTMTIFIHLEASAAPSDLNPYGDFRIDYCGKPDGGPDGCMMNGYLIGSASGITFYEREPAQNDSGPIPNQYFTKALQLTRSGDTAGAGRLSIDEGEGLETFNFAYNATHFRRDDGTQDHCFSRSAAAASSSVWRYGLYDNDNGARLDVNSGFPIEFARGDETVRGFIGYWGLSVPGSPPANGATVTQVDYGNNGATRTHYTYESIGGRLVRYDKVTKALSEVQGLKITVWLNDLFDVLGGEHRPGQVDVAWNGSTFSVVGTQNCGNNGCVSQDVTGANPLTVEAFAMQGGLRGWSQALGGEVFIPVGRTATTLADDAPVLLREQSLVYPTSMGDIGALECLNNCPTPTSITAFVNQQASTPFGDTAFNWMAAATVSYTLADGALTYGGAAVTATGGLGDGRPEYQQGLRSGRLFPTAARASLACDAPAPQGMLCDSKTEGLDTYYVWETGPNAWNQFAGLKDGSGHFVSFDPPKNVDYAVPNDEAFGGFAGRTLVLQYSGFGQLWGIPGHCVDARSNQAVDCGNGDQRNTRYVPAFSIPFEQTAAGRVLERLNGESSRPYLVKWLDREQRFARAPGQCTTLDLPTSFTLPTEAGLRDTSAPVSSEVSYRIGAKPTLAADVSPRVIHGEVKY